jgi:hypothetical protein
MFWLGNWGQGFASFFFFFAVSWAHYKIALKFLIDWSLMSPVSFLFQWITIHNNFFATKISWANFCCEKKYYSRIIARKGAGKGILWAKVEEWLKGVLIRGGGGAMMLNQWGQSIKKYY